MRPLRDNEMGDTVRLRRSTAGGAPVGVGGELAVALAVHSSADMSRFCNNFVDLTRSSSLDLFISS